MGTSALRELTELGVSIWLDDLSRTRLDSGSLAQLIRTHYVRGVTSNPAIFEQAISKGADAYATDLRELAHAGHDVDGIIQRLTTDDVRRACDLLLPFYRETNGVDGRVSLEVDPRLANDTAGTVTQAKALWALVDRPNLMIKVPATRAGMRATAALIATGISVNVTLIFSAERYREVCNAFMIGLERAQAAGLDLGAVHSVASIFVSRVDTAVDAVLTEMASPQALALRGRAGIANVLLVWQAHTDCVATQRWQRLAAAGARMQRPLWASTGVKDPTYDDTRYVVELAVPGTVNTMPEATLQAVFDHGVCAGDTVSGREFAAAMTWAELEALGVSRHGVCERLERDGIAAFIAAWERLRDTVQLAMRDATDTVRRT